MSKSSKVMNTKENLKTNQELESSNAHSYTQCEICTRKMAGKILTIIDASIQDKQQNKALKDLIKSEIKEHLWELQERLLGDAGHSVEL